MDTPQTARLRESLESLRRRDGISLTAQARQIGVSHSQLSLFNRGKRGVGEKLLRGIMTNLPELAPAVAEYLGNGHDTD
jgi:transcriptional regulator with XRE-family HTH domain